VDATESMEFHARNLIKIQKRKRTEAKSRRVKLEAQVEEAVEEAIGRARRPR